MDKSIEKEEHTFFEGQKKAEKTVQCEEEQCLKSWENPVEAAFSLKGQDIRAYSPLVLAFIGDSVYDLIVRTVVVEQGNTHVNLLHKRCSQLVKADAQAAMIERLLPLLSEEETAVYKRGRNAKVVSKARNASLASYKKATGFEALMGYLYLEHKMERILELVKLGLKEELCRKQIL